jgi:hypothetical protein
VYTAATLSNTDYTYFVLLYAYKCIPNMPSGEHS